MTLLVPHVTINMGLHFSKVPKEYRGIKGIQVVIGKEWPLTADEAVTAAEQWIRGFYADTINRAPDDSQESKP